MSERWRKGRGWRPSNSNKSGRLKGQAHNIFQCWLFHHTVPPGPVGDAKIPSFFLSNIYGNFNIKFFHGETIHYRVEQKGPNRNISKSYI